MVYPNVKTDFNKGNIPWNKGVRGYKCFYPRIQDMLENILQLVQEGKSSYQISKLIGLHPKTVYSCLEKNKCKDAFVKLQNNGLVRRNNSAVKISLADIDALLKLSEEGRGIDYIGKKLGFDGTSIRYQLIKRLGKKEYSKRHNVKKFTDYWSGKWFLGSRGEKFQSQWEEKVADFLYLNNIKYALHIRLDLPEGKFFPDFYLPEHSMYIEVFGMSDLNFYIEKMNKKETAYKNNKIKYIPIYKKDLGRYQFIISNQLLNVCI